MAEYIERGMLLDRIRGLGYADEIKENLLFMAAALPSVEITSADNKHRFSKKQMKLKELLPMFRSAGYSNYDESGSTIILCPECEEWTWVRFNLHNGLLDVLGELNVDSIDIDDNCIRFWIETDDFNYFDKARTTRAEAEAVPKGVSEDGK